VIILIAHQKGGVGKSTLAVNLAAEAQRRGGDVLIAEGDPTIHTARNWARVRASANAAPITSVKLEGAIHTNLTDLGKRYDYVIVDVAGKDSREMRSAMTAAHVMVTPILPSQADVDSSNSLSRTIVDARDFNPGLAVIAVLNRCSTQWNDTEADESAEYMKDYPELPLADVRLHDRKAYRRSLETGLGVVELKDPKAKAEIQLLMNEILEAGNGR
jgi:chromosome partitioning protein